MGTHVRLLLMFESIFNRTHTKWNKNENDLIIMSLLYLVGLLPDNEWITNVHMYIFSLRPRSFCFITKLIRIVWYAQMCTFLCVGTNKSFQTTKENNLLSHINVCKGKNSFWMFVMKGNICSLVFSCDSIFCWIQNKKSRQLELILT